VPALADDFGRLVGALHGHGSKFLKDGVFGFRARAYRELARLSQILMGYQGLGGVHGRLMKLLCRGVDGRGHKRQVLTRSWRSR
jgi:hypothetical protein